MPVALSGLRDTLVVAAIAATIGCARAEDGPPTERGPAPERAPTRPQCFSIAQTRAEIEAHRLVDPFVSMRNIAIYANGEPLGARLCRHGEVFIYEINVLRHDGRIVKVLVDAVSGQPQPGQTGK